MRKFLSFIFGMVLLSLLPQKAWCQEAYAVVSGDVGTYTFTFYYDELKDSREGQIFSTDEIQVGEFNQYPSWVNINNNRVTTSIPYVQYVVFDPSFADARPTSTSYWFFGMNVISIEGLQYLNTSEVTDMSHMFYWCSELKEVDLSHFNTSNVKRMDSMFGDCYSLTSLDFSNFDCSSLENWGLSGCWGMFNCCRSLKSVTIAEGLSFSTYECEQVGTPEDPCVINYPEGYDFGVDTSGDYFEWCSGYFKLGNAYIPTSVTPTEKEAYAVYNNGTFTFYCDDLKSTREGQVYETDEFNEYGFAKWIKWNGNTEVQTLIDVNKVVIDPSFADARPTKTASWFKDMSSLTTIEGLEYLNTSNVEEMSMMFYFCRSLTNIDLSHFDTSKVFNMMNMFAYCTSLQELDLSNFDTSNVENMNQMFSGCSNLKSINLSSFNTSKVEGFLYTFADCSSLETLDVSNFDTSKATGAYFWTDSSGMFVGCANLKTLSISSTMSNLNNDACEEVGTVEKPCLIIAPEGFDYGVDTSGNYFQWKSGYFTLGNTTPLVTLSNGDNEEPLSEYDGMTVDVELEEYTCQPEKWYSLCVPFDISAEQLKEAFGDDVDIQEMTGCAWNASEQILDMNFNKVTEVLAGRPYLLRVAGAVDAPQFDGVTINSDDPLTLNFGNCTMTGVLNATPLPLGDKSYLFIINNKFYYPATTNPLPAMRCYFHLLGDAAQANSIALNMEDDADGIVSVISDSAADSRVYYSVQGVSTTRPTHGIYINNGKKVVIK